MDELKPCPFCGGEAEMCHVSQLWEPKESYWAKCTKCHMSGNHFNTEAEAIAAWNTRAERTCRQKRLFNLIRRECDGELYQWHGEEKPHYCPTCGAKVVDG